MKALIKASRLNAAHRVIQQWRNPLKRQALYPFLFTLNLILTPLAHNLDQIDPSLALRPLIALELASAIGLILFYILFRDWQYAGYLVFLIILNFFGLGYLLRFILDQLSIFATMLDERIFLAVCTGILGICAIKGFWTRLGGRTWLVHYLNLLCALGLIFPFYELLSGFIHPPFQAGKVSSSAQASFGDTWLDCSNTPDIYYIVLDGYGRADMLEDVYEIDNQPFLENLRRRGFYVAGESFTNYIQTNYSIPSGLNYNFIDPPGGGVRGLMLLSGLMRRNNIMAVLKRCGYRTVSIESGFYSTDHPEVDFYLERGIGPNAFESLLLADSPVDVLAAELNLAPSDLSYEAHRQRVLYAFEKLGTLYQIAGPKFIFAHILSPHPPFVFDGSGQPVDPKWRYYCGDGDDYQGSLDDYLSGYSEQVQFVNRKLEQVIDSVLANSSSPSIIIIQGDHGPGSHLVWDSPGETCLWERTPILNAYYLPGEGDRLLYPSISPVNTFRVVLNAYFGADLPLLPDATYFTSHLLERQAIDITALRSSRSNCDPP